MGVLSIERGKLNAPLSRSLQRLHTFATWILPVPEIEVLPGTPAPSLAATAWVQLANPAQDAGFRAFSKKGCGVTAARFAAQLPPAIPAFPPQYCQTIWPYALSNRCPPRVIM